jgi:hypothetical protein
LLSLFFYLEDPLQRKWCLFLMALNINEWYWKHWNALVRGWGLLQNYKHELRTVIGPTPNGANLGFYTGL